MFLDWINVEVSSYDDLLWHLASNPPPANVPDHDDHTAVIQEKPTTESREGPQDASSRSIQSSHNKHEIQYPVPLVVPNHPVPSPDQQRATQPFKVPQVIPNNSTRRPRLFALFIGIDNYAHVKTLRGAVSDAIRMREYMQRTFKVPDDQIKELLNESASRENIIAWFRALANDDFKNVKINWGDAILIFYAGHGDLIIAPRGWSSGRPDNKIQSIVPHNFCKGKVEVIPDRTIGSLINMIAKKHGDNITVIFDCCHSGSATRDIDGTIRSAGLQFENYNILPSLDSDIWGSKTTPRDLDIRGSENNPQGMQSATGLAVTGLSSHVFLSACSANEVACEDRRSGGRFTTALLKVFHKTSPDQLTYEQVLDRLDQIPGQNPQLEGENRHRIFFNAQATPPYHICYDIYQDDIRQFILKAGEAHGVCMGAEFTVYQDEQHLFSNPVLGVLVVHLIFPFETVMRIAPGCRDFTLKSPAVAIQTKAGRDQELKLYVPRDNKYLSIFQALLSRMRRTGSNPRKIALAEDHLVANLEAVSRGNKLSFNILDARIAVDGQLAIPYSVDATDASVSRVLEGAAHYYYHLNRAYTDPLIQKHVKVEMFKLVKSGEIEPDMGEPIYVPAGENLIVGNKITRNVCDHITPSYGVSIRNTSGRDLFVNCFLFNNVNLSVASVFTSEDESHSKIDSPLLSKGSLTFGYGSGGVRPQEFVLPPGRDLVTGFLKFFISSKSVDLSNISQSTPFLPPPDIPRSQDRGCALRSAGSEDVIRSKKGEFVDILGSILIPLVLTRHCDH